MKLSFLKYGLDLDDGSVIKALISQMWQHKLDPQKTCRRTKAAL